MKKMMTGLLAAVLMLWACVPDKAAQVTLDTAEFTVSVVHLAMAYDEAATIVEQVKPAMSAYEQTMLTEIDSNFRAMIRELRGVVPKDGLTTFALNLSDLARHYETARHNYRLAKAIVSANRARYDARQLAVLADFDRKAVEIDARYQAAMTAPGGGPSAAKMVLETIGFAASMATKVLPLLAVL